MAGGKGLWSCIDRAMVFLGALLFAGAAHGIHQMQTAEGMGLYWVQKTGGTLWLMNGLVDLLAVGALFLLILVPARLLRHTQAVAFFRLLSGFLAFMPPLSMSHLLHMWKEGASGFDPELVLFVLGTVLPFVAFLFLGVECFERSWKGWYGGAGLAALLFLAAMGWESQVFGFLLVYTLLLVGFDLWERLLLVSPKIGRFGKLLFGLLWIRAFYRVLMLWSVY